MAKRKTDPYAEQADAQAILRFGPEFSALRALLSQATEDRDLALRQARAGRDYTLGAVDAAVPTVRRAYRGAQQAVSPAFAQAGGVEASALNARLGESQALAETQLRNRRVGAIEGEGAAKTVALRNFRSDRGKIGARLTDLARETGAFTTSTIGDLMGADAKAMADAQRDAAQRTQTERNAWIGAGVDPNTGKAIPGGRLDPKAKPGKPNAGRGWASQTEQASAKDEIDRLLMEAKESAAAGETRREVADLLGRGAEDVEQPVYRTVTTEDAQGRKHTKQERVLNPDGTQKTRRVPGVEKAKSQLLMQAALDMAYDGHLSRRTQKLLHDRGIQLEPLGLVTFGEWLKTPEGQAWKAAQGANKTPQRRRPANTRSIRDIYG